MAAKHLAGLLFITFANLSLVGSIEASDRADRPLSRDELRQAEQRLADLGYWTGPVDGVWDEASRQAMIAFQKVDGRKATGRLARADLAALARAVPPLPREAGPPHLEVDLARQVLFLVDADGRVGSILPVSSGSGKRFHENGYPETLAQTPCGHLEVFSKLTGWKTSPLGEMFNPLYIVGGIAIHGSLDVPAHPASHGCIRVPMFASRRLPRMVPMKMPVLVYGCRDEAPGPIAAQLPPTDATTAPAQ
ncbi:MAG TPA: L,D-transpeptidase family protein [Thermoanaerobaculia bacterium]|nr:L,D-transpeptidase family protein [Thermoanaerobaculia bacterium]